MILNKLLQDNYEEEDYEEEGYEEEGYEEGGYEEEVLTPLSPKDLELIETEYSEPKYEDSIEEISYLYDSYLKIKKLKPEIEYEEEMMEYSLNVIQARIDEFEIPTDDLLYLFVFVLTVESYEKKLKGNNFFDNLSEKTGLKRSSVSGGLLEDLKGDKGLGGLSSMAGLKRTLTPGGSSEESQSSLMPRINEYLEENPDLFCDLEIYDNLFNIQPELQKTPTYEKVLRQCYEDLIASESNESLAAMLQLYNEERPLTDEFVAKVTIPSDSLEDFKRAFNLIINNPRQTDALKKRENDLLKIINEKQYASDPELAAFVTKKASQKTGQTYKRVMSLSLILPLIGFIINPVVGLVVAVLWAVVFFVPPVRNLIPFLKKGKESLEASKKK